MLSLLFATAVLAPAKQASPIGEVPFVIADGQIVVAATVNNRDLHLIFDTGFASIAIVDTTIDLGKPSGTQTLTDFVGTVEVQAVPLKSVKLGNVTLAIKDEEALQQSGIAEFGSGTHVDGLMGFAAIKDMVTEIDFKDKKFIFFPANTDLSKRVPDNKTTFLLPMEPIGTRSIILPVKDGNGKLFHMALDTGNAFYATVNRDGLERNGLWKEGQEPKFIEESGVASGSVNSWSKRMKDMTIFGVPVPLSVWDIIDRPAADSVMDGTVGFDFLKHFNITFDFKHRYVWLENFSGTVVDDPEGSLGISAIWSKNRKAVVIVRVSPESPADKAGIKQGDNLLSLDDDDLGEMSYRKIRMLLRGAIGSKAKLTVSRNGISRRVTLVREELVNP
jgi:hypothetical protein